MDRDDTDGFGPEIITIKQLEPGTYRFYVVDYSSSGQAQPYLGNSKAKVSVYRDSALTDSFQVTSGVLASQWNVFEMTVDNDGYLTIKGVNTYQ